MIIKTFRHSFYVYLIGLTSSCACVVSPEAWAGEYLISSEFSDDEIELIIDAIEDWCNVSSDTCFPYSIVDGAYANIIRREAFDIGDGLISCGFFENNNTIVLNIGFGCDVGRDMRHEIGHIFVGSNHIEDNGHLMSAVTYIGAVFDCIPYTDAEFVCKYAGCENFNPTCKEQKYEN